MENRRSSSWEVATFAAHLRLNGYAPATAQPASGGHASNRRMLDEEPPAYLLDPPPIPEWMQEQMRERSLYEEPFGTEFEDDSWDEDSPTDGSDDPGPWTLVSSGTDDAGYVVVEPTGRLRELDPRERLLGATMNDSLPCAELGFVLGNIDPASYQDEELVDAIAAWDRMRSWVEAEQLRAIAELSTRPSMRPDWPASAGEVTVKDTTGDEVAIRLQCSRMQARQRVELARELFLGRLDLTGRALQSGHISPEKARTVARELDCVDIEDASIIQGRVLPSAGAKTPAQLGRAIARERVRLYGHDQAAVRVPESGGEWNVRGLFPTTWLAGRPCCPPRMQSLLTRYWTIRLGRCATAATSGP